MYVPIAKYMKRNIPSIRRIIQLLVAALSVSIRRGSYGILYVCIYYVCMYVYMHGTYTWATLAALGEVTFLLQTN